MTLNRLFLTLVSIFFLVAALVAAFAAYTAILIRDSSNDLQPMFERVRLSEELQINLLNTNREWLLYSLTQDQEHENDRITAEQELNSNLRELTRYIHTQEDQFYVNQVIRSMRDYFQQRDRLSASPGNFIQSYQEANRYLRLAHTQAAQLARFNLNEASEVVDRNRTSAEFATLVAIGAILVIAILLPFLWLSIRKWIYLPIKRLRSGIQHYKADVDYTIEMPMGITEINEVTEAFNDLAWRIADQRKARLRFLAGVAHDLKNPLGAIKMSVEMLGRKNLPLEESGQMISIISRQADQLIRMIGDFLDASRIGSGHLELIKKPLDLRSIVQDAVLLNQQTSDRHEILFELPEESYQCNCDRMRINQVMNNLLNNAIKYSPGGGRIFVRMKKEDGLAVISVSDEGIGIAEEDQPKIFEPFRRTQATKETIPGVGLGLSISKLIIEGHNGSLELKSRLGIGTTFSFKLPLIPEIELRTPLIEPKQDVSDQDTMI